MAAQAPTVYLLAPEPLVPSQSKLLNQTGDTADHAAVFGFDDRPLEPLEAATIRPAEALHRYTAPPSEYRF
ncbi:hypothetical protein D3C73_1236600 [compost metagenome]